MKKTFTKKIFSLFLFCMVSFTIHSQGTRLLRNPAVSDNVIAFGYAGDLWIVGRDGGEARRLTSSPGIEIDPCFSPDGQSIAFTGNYSGNFEIYVINARGGEPKRLTWHPSTDHALGWTSDGKKILLTSDRASYPISFPQLWVMPVEGGLPERLPIRSVQRASFSTGDKLLAYEDIRWQSEWKWYRGGQAKPISIISFPDLTLSEVPGPVCLNTCPVFLGDKLYFLSDRDGTFNIYEYVIGTRSLNQLTHHTEFDIKSLSAGGGILVYEIAGNIHTLNPASGEDKELTIMIHGDFPWAMEHWTDVSKNITSASLSPGGARALFEARGDIFTVPAEKGDVRNLSHSPGVADHSPAWSPDGQKIAWFSDKSGEYKLIISDQDGLKPQKEIAIDHPTYFYNLTWSPDSKNLAFTNARRELMILDLEKETIRSVDTDRMAHPERTMIPRWAPDSRWIAYAKQLPNAYHSIMIYSLVDNKSYQITDGLSDAVEPAWDPGKKYLYFLASTDVGLNTGWLDLSSLERPQRRSVYFAVLSKDTISPLLPQSDEEKALAQIKTAEKEKVRAKGKTIPLNKNKEADSVNLRIDFDSIANRILSLPLPPRNYVDLHTGPPDIIYVSEQELPFYPEHPQGPAINVHRWNMGSRKDTLLLKNVSSFNTSSRGSKLIYRQGDSWFITGPENESKSDGGRLNVQLKVNLDPITEWNQIYREAWRLFRDYFYVSNYHGADWNKVYEKYAVLLPYVRHRSDLNYLLDLMGGELAVGHHFVFGEDMGEQVQTNIGLLGADYSIDNDHYRFRKIYTGENWNPNLRAPLAAPGINVHEGDYLLAVNGIPLSPPMVPESLLEGLGGKQVTLLVNSKPSPEGAHNITVVPVESEVSLRSRSWVENNRRLVDKLSGGTIAYVWLPDTYEGGYTYFNRYYFGQQDRHGVILDERFNGGGDIADYIIDIVKRKLRGYFNNPVGKHDPWTEPLAGIWGPKVMIINEFAGSGGDMLPYMFRQEQLGPLVGTRTWGGLVGIWDFNPLLDNGGVTVPRGGFFNLQGEWDVENKGIAPDIKADISPGDIAAGRDPQLERALEEAIRLLKLEPVKLMKEPSPPVRTNPGVK